MRGFQQLARNLSRMCVDSGSTQGLSPACHSISAARAYSSAISSVVQVRESNVVTGLVSSPGSPWSCQLTPIAAAHHRCFSSDTSEQLPGDDHVEAASQVAAFDPSSILSAVAGMEEDSWAAAQEDVWFFNRYMQTALRTAQELTGLPW